MIEVFKYVDKFFTSLTNYLTYNYIFIIFVGLFLFTMLCVAFFTSRSYEARLIKAIDKFNMYFIDNPHINEENLVAFNAKMKDKKVPKQLRKNWQQFVLYREDKASTYMSFENCVSTPIKNSTYTRDVKLMNTLAWIFSFCALILNCYYCFETADLAGVLQKVLLAPVIILLLNYIVQIFLNLKHSAIISDLFQNYQYFEVNIDKACETLPDYVDYEVLFDRNEIKKGIPILYSYLQKRAEEEQRELERVRLRNVEHEKFNFDDQGVAASLVLERAMQEAENYIAERKKYNQDTQQINSDITQEEMNFREITKEYNRQMQVSKETFANFKSQMEDVSSTIEANYLKKQQQQELDRQRNLERDYDTASEKHKKVLESYQAELDSVDKFIAQSRKNLEDAMKSEFSTYSSKVYDEAKKVVDERKKDSVDKLKQNITSLEETLVLKNQELEQLYQQNQVMSDKLLEIGIVINDQPVERAPEQAPTQNYQHIQEQEEPDEEPVENPDGEEPLETKPEENYYLQEGENLEYEEEEPNYESEYEAQYQDNNDFNNQYYQEPADVQEAEEWQEPQAEEQAELQSDEQPEQGNDKEYDFTVEPENLFAVEDTFDNNEESDNSDNEDPYKEFDDIFNNKENLFKDEDLFSDDEFEDEEESLDEDDISTEQTDDSIQEVSRRGRPRKVIDTEKQGEKRGPGRPRKVETEVVSLKPKKGPGRPRKVQTNSVSTPKRSVGRPRKEAVATSTVKKGPGRPRKVESTSTPKRSVGRPRKEAVVSTSAKKGPGRPRKANSYAPAVKKGRGRPRKQVEVPNDIKDIDEYLKEIDNAIAVENAKLERTQKELAKKAKLKGKK